MYIAKGNRLVEICTKHKSIHNNNTKILKLKSDKNVSSLI